MVKRQASKEDEGDTAAGKSSGEPQPASPSVVAAPAADTTPSEGETHSAGSRVPSRGHMADGDGCTTPSLLDAAWPSSHTESPSPRRRPRIRQDAIGFYPGFYPGTRTGCTRRTGTPLRPAPSGGYRAGGPVHTLSRAAPPVGRRQAPLWRTGAASTGHAHCEHGPSHDRHRPRVCRTQATSCLTFAEIASPCHGASCRCVCRPHTRRWRTISVPGIARSVLRYRGYEHRRCMPS